MDDDVTVSIDPVGYVRDARVDERVFSRPGIGRVSLMAQFLNRNSSHSDKGSLYPSVLNSDSDYIKSRVC